MYPEWFGGPWRMEARWLPPSGRLELTMVRASGSNWKRVLGITAAVLAALVLSAVTVVALRAEAWANDYARDLQTKWSTELGRPVRIGAIRVAPFRGTLRVARIVIGAAPDAPRATPMALTVDQVAVDIGMLRTLLSAGTQPYVESVDVRAAQLNVVRLPDGTLNWQHIADRLQRARAQAPEQGPSARARNTVVGRARLQQGEVAFLELGRHGAQDGARPEARISAIELRLDDAGYRHGMRVSMQAAVLAREPNLLLHAVTSGVRQQHGRNAPPVIRELALHLSPTQLSPLAPFVAALGGVAGNTPEHGVLSADVSVDRSGDTSTGEGKLTLADLDVRTHAARFAGGGQASFSMRRQPQRWTAQARADFTHLRAVYPGVIRKPEATPFTFRAQLSGVPDRPQTFAADVPSFALSAGRSDVRGSMKLSNWQNPYITLQARSHYLDPSDFLPERKKPRERKPSTLAKANGSIALHADAGKVSGVDFSELDAELRLHDGRATAKTLRVTSFGGQLSGQGSEFPLFGTPGPVHVRGDLRGMQVQKLLARFAGAPELLRGSLAGRIDVTSAGGTLADVRDSLTGRLSGSVDDGAFLPASGYAALAQRLQSLAPLPALAQAIERAGKRVAGGDGWQLADLRGSLRFERGAVRIEQPLTARTPEGALSLSGRVSLSEAGKLTGTWQLEPDALQKLVGTRLELKQPIPIALHIDGPLTRPRFGFGGLEPVLERVASAYAGSQVGPAARKALQKALDQTGLGGAPPARKSGESRGAKQPNQGESKKRPERPQD